MIKIRMAVLGLVLVSLACSKSETPAPEKAGNSAPETKVAAGGYELDSAETDVSFMIVSNSAGPITARFPKGVSGSLDASGKGTVSIQLDTMYSLDQNNLENPLRDANVIEAFFGVRPSAILPEPVDKAWEALAGKIERSVATARFEISEATGLDTATGNLTGNLVIWNKISVPLTFAVNVTRADNRVELTSTAPVAFDLIEVLGADLRKLTFDTMLAAGCAHQPGIQNKVEISLNKVVMNAK
ncbi:MAG: YceI family protein [Acidobacteriota bacterium]|nr:YceI family protein [Acidobacteriota bacterium]